jgi:hypothetical protein
MAKLRVNGVVKYTGRSKKSPDKKFPKRRNKLREKTASELLDKNCPKRRNKPREKTASELLDVAIELLTKAYKNGTFIFIFLLLFIFQFKSSLVSFARFMNRT